MTLLVVSIFTVCLSFAPQNVSAKSEKTRASQNAQRASKKNSIKSKQKSAAQKVATSSATKAAAAESSAKVVTAAPSAGEDNGTIRITDVESGANGEDQKLSAILKFVFDNESAKHGWPANYTTLWCPSNVFNLLRRLDQAGVDLSKANVWYILPKSSTKQAGENVVHPKLARGGPTEWSFHVVVEVQGRVLDLDFTDHPRVVSKAEYGSLMWQKGPSAVIVDKQVLFARVIPARDYLSSYTGNWTWYASGGGGRYDAVVFDTLL